jgi:hypothetical protein
MGKKFKDLLLFAFVKLVITFTQETSPLLLKSG